MGKSTPGPWTADEDMGCVWGPDGEPIGTNGRNAVRGNGEGWANARLIAAAPELLAALKALVKPLLGNVCPEPACNWCVAIAAIAKAEGGGK